MWSLDTWFAARDLLRRVYREELGRDVIGDPDALTNWLYHMREYDHDEAWLRDRFRESDEYRQSHGGAPPDAPSPPPPSPSQGRVIHVTSGQDGTISPRLYPGWTNTWLQTSELAVVFAGHPEGLPSFFAVNLSTGVVGRLEPRIPYGGTTEGWSWDREGRLVFCEGPRLHRFNPWTGRDEILLDISDTMPGCDLWQPHSADNGKVHAATVRDAAHPRENGSYPYLGTVILTNGQRMFEASPPDMLDESAVTRDGSHVIIKVKRNGGDDNYVINLESGERWWIADGERAMGHSDCGPDFIIGEADKPDPGGCGVWYLREHRFQFLFQTLNMGYVSYGGGVVIHTDETRISRVDLANGQQTPICEHGGSSADSYDERVKASLDFTGQVATYMVRGAIYLVRL